MATALVEMTVRPLSDALGAEILGVDLSQQLTAATMAAVEDAWHRNLILVFRDQNISNDDQVRFCKHGICGPNVDPTGLSPCKVGPKYFSKQLEYLWFAQL